jgi:hypothetical protein
MKYLLLFETSYYYLLNILPQSVASKSTDKRQSHFQKVKNLGFIKHMGSRFNQGREQGQICGRPVLENVTNKNTVSQSEGTSKVFEPRNDQDRKLVDNNLTPRKTYDTANE